ncbi:MAG: hypothetical protein VCC00_12360 [Deltaproteobacteria bacterium]
MNPPAEDPIQLASRALADLRDPIFAEAWPLWPFLLAAVLLVILFFVLRVRHQPAPEIVPDALGRAHAALAVAGGFAGSGQAEAWAIAASDALRGYVEATGALPATRRTSQEILAAFPAPPPDLALFCNRSDLLKFASTQASPPDLPDWQERAKILLLALAARTEAQP